MMWDHQTADNVGSTIQFSNFLSHTYEDTFDMIRAEWELQKDRQEERMLRDSSGYQDARAKACPSLFIRAVLRVGGQGTFLKSKIGSWVSAANFKKHTAEWGQFCLARTLLPLNWRS